MSQPHSLTPTPTRRGQDSPADLPPVVAWEQLGPQFFEVWGRPHGTVMPEHLSVYGPSGSGKTYFITYVMTERARLRGTHAVVVATKKADRTLTEAGWPVIKDWPPDYGQNQVIWWARGGLSDQQQAEQSKRVHMMMHTLWQEDANKIIAWDELPYVSLDLGLGRQVATYYREGRSLGITNIAALQRPAGVPRHVHSEVSWTVAFRPKDQDDRDRVAEILGNRKYYRDVLESLDREKRQFVIKRELTGEAFISSLPGTRPVLPDSKDQPGNTSMS